MKISIRNTLKSFETAFWEKTYSSITPSIFQHNYLHHVALYEKLIESFALVRRQAKKSRFDILDVGSGNKPYLELFKPFSQKYVGVDIDSRVADIVAKAEKLPLKDASFDLVLCFQTLEHCQDPQKVIAEIYRILKMGGQVILSTHGAWMYHPAPHDFYRWTGEGLERLFRKFSWVNAKPTLRSFPSLIQLLCLELYGVACRHFWLKIPIYGAIVLLNLIGKSLQNTGPDHFTVNYIVVARK